MGVSEMEWRTKKERKLLRDLKVDRFALIRRHPNMSGNGKETQIGVIPVKTLSGRKI